MVSMVALYSNVLGTNPTEVNNLRVSKNCWKRTTINEDEAYIGPFVYIYMPLGR